MAARACAELVPPGSPIPARPGSFPRVATRTPGRDLADVAAAREFARATLQRWGLAASCDDITLVASELLSNALRHAVPESGGWPVRFGLLQPWPGSTVLCAVADPSTTMPVPGPPGALAESGRGLHVIAELSDRWGYAPLGQRGKVVWAAFDVRDSLAEPADDPDAGAWRYVGR